MDLLTHDSLTDSLTDRITFGVGTNNRTHVLVFRRRTCELYVPMIKLFRMFLSFGTIDGDPVRSVVM
jgi:hypothetical protein